MTMNLPTKPLKFSPEAVAVFDAGRELWRYYHTEAYKRDPEYNVNASLYDIREYFKGRNAKGKMNRKSADVRFNELDKALRDKLEILALKIKPKVYEYGFLKPETMLDPEVKPRPIPVTDEKSNGLSPMDQAWLKYHLSRLPPIQPDTKSSTPATD